MQIFDVLKKKNVEQRNTVGYILGYAILLRSFIFMHPSRAKDIDSMKKRKPQHFVKPFH